MGFTVYPSYEAGASCASVSVPVFGSLVRLSGATCCRVRAVVLAVGWCGLGVRLWGLAGRFERLCPVLGIRAVGLLHTGTLLAVCGLWDW